MRNAAERSRSVPSEDTTPTAPVPAFVSPATSPSSRSTRKARAALAGPDPHPLDPETAARALRVLLELGLVAGSTSAGAGAVSVVSSEGTDLERSAAFRVYSKEHSEAQSFLQSQKSP